MTVSAALFTYFQLQFQQKKPEETYFVHNMSVILLSCMALSYRLVEQAERKPVEQVLIPLEITVCLPVRQGSDTLGQTINSLHIVESVATVVSNE